jgi:hypothetical protein
MVQKQLADKNINVFSGKDFDDKESGTGLEFQDMITIDEILDKCEDLIIENKELQDELDDLKQDLHDNYIPKSQED